MRKRNMPPMPVGRKPNPTSGLTGQGLNPLPMPAGQRVNQTSRPARLKLNTLPTLAEGLLPADETEADASRNVRVSGAASR